MPTKESKDIFEADRVGNLRRNRVRAEVYGQISRDLDAEVEGLIERHVTAWRLLWWRIFATTTILGVSSTILGWYFMGVALRLDVQSFLLGITTMAIVAPPLLVHAITRMWGGGSLLMVIGADLSPKPFSLHKKEIDLFLHKLQSKVQSTQTVNPIRHHTPLLKLRLSLQGWLWQRTTRGIVATEHRQWQRYLEYRFWGELFFWLLSTLVVVYGIVAMTISGNGLWAMICTAASVWALTLGFPDYARLRSAIVYTAYEYAAGKILDAEDDSLAKK